MNRLWNLCAFLAVANLVVLAGIVAWLFTSGRVDSTRIERLQALFALPVEVEQARLEAEETARQQELEASLEERSLVALPASSRWPIDSLTKIRLERERMERRFRDELQRDSNEVLAAEQRLQSERAAFELEKAEFLRNQAEEAALREDADFKQAVKDLESMTAKGAKNLIVETYGTDPGGEVLVLRWMRAMRQGTRSAIIASMKSEDELKLASSLLRSLAEPPASSGAAPETPDATSVTSADPS